ncbi:hypothetical protein GH714_034223 [Hevea brasiliensis]|uniref:Glycosyltransferase n=1 Tax=Hevea brasiliensis TaxID=3981 RepID=A0A6A6NKI1_HEVBR|nr:hypothetical protein GH714_034223 [Hevea brasiliensis]
MMQPHFLLVTFPAQGHINPALQFAKCLIRIGVHVTLATCLSATRRMAKTSFPDGLSLATFSDGYDDGFKFGHDDHNNYASEIKRRGSQTLSDTIVAKENEGKPFSCVVYTLLLPWAAEVARAHHLPSTLLWIQPSTVLSVFYYYFNGFGDLFSNCSDPTYVVQLPGKLPPFTGRDLPSFLVPSNLYTFALASFKEQLETLSEESNPKILVNTFDALEPEALKAIEKFNMIGIGPLLPSAFLDRKDPSDTAFGADLFQSSKGYKEWLNSKPKSSVIYVSFGSICVLSKQQMEEIARGLLNSSRPFLWVLREEPLVDGTNEENQLSCRQELEEKGMIVPWCSQVEVLSHPSLGCFVTHCGWNSTLEGLVSGVPMVAFPQWTDQGTNAKLIEDEWQTGVRVVPNEEGIVVGEEMVRCLELVMGDGKNAEEKRNNSKKWKNLAIEAVKEGGSSEKNLRAFVDEIIGGCCS